MIQKSPLVQKTERRRNFYVVTFFIFFMFICTLLYGLQQPISEVVSIGLFVASFGCIIAGAMVAMKLYKLSNSIFIQKKTLLLNYYSPRDIIFDSQNNEHQWFPEDVIELRKNLKKSVAVSYGESVVWQDYLHLYKQYKMSVPKKFRIVMTFACPEQESIEMFQKVRGLFWGNVDENTIPVMEKVWIAHYMEIFLESEFIEWGPDENHILHLEQFFERQFKNTFALPVVVKVEKLLGI